MRKWMRERVMRRRKPKEEAKPESTQAPLQPAYFDAAPASDSAPREIDGNRAEPDAPQPRRAKPEAASVDSQVVSHSQAENDLSVAPPSSRPKPARNDNASDNDRPLRRRSRGGRGRGRSGSGAESARTKAPSEAAPVPAVPSAITAAAAPASPKGTVVLAIGLPGSGKSSWFKRNNVTPLSSDMLRALLFDDPVEQRFQDLVFSNLRSMLKARLIAKRPMSYVDTTNLTPQERQNWIKLARDYGYEVQAVYFDVPLEICLERNAKRQRVVPEDVMRRMAAKLKAPEFGEGFSKITVVRVKQKE
jgi:predicted kinase